MVAFRVYAVATNGATDRYTHCVCLEWLPDHASKSTKNELQSLGESPSNAEFWWESAPMIKPYGYEAIEQAAKPAPLQCRGGFINDRES